MENASKALLMAAAVLIGILVLTLIVYLYANFSAIKADSVEKMNQTSLDAFNGKFLAYDGRTDLTYYDIANIATMVKNYNDEIGNDDENKIVIVIGNTTINLTNSNTWYNRLMKAFKDQDSVDNIMKTDTVSDSATGTLKQVKVLKRYICKVDIDQNGTTGRVRTIRFTEN